MKYYIFKLVTERSITIVPETRGMLFGRAWLYDSEYRPWPDRDGEVLDFSSNQESIIKRMNEMDDVWEQRVIAAAIEFLEAQNYQFRCLTDATPHPDPEKISLEEKSFELRCPVGNTIPPNPERKRVWMIVTSH